jgi:hypothetical protein
MQIKKIVCCFTKHRIVLNDMMIDELSTVKDLEGSGCGPIEVLSRNLPTGTEENHGKLRQ